MDVSPHAAHLPPDTADVAGRRQAGRMLGDAKALAAVVLLLSAAADPPAPDMTQLRRLVALLNPCGPPDEETASMLRQIYGAVDDIRRLVE